MKLYTCEVCACTVAQPTEAWAFQTADLPPGTSVRTLWYCSAECFRRLYGAAAVARMFPGQATAAEVAELEAHEERLLARASKRSARLYEAMRARIEADRERREEARRQRGEQ